MIMESGRYDNVSKTYYNSKVVRVQLMADILG